MTKKEREFLESGDILPGSLQDLVERQAYGDPPEGEEQEEWPVCPTVFCPVNDQPKKRKAKRNEKAKRS